MCCTVDADFNTTSFTVTFPADENGGVVPSIAIRVGIVDDNINERFEQLYLIGVEVVDALDPSTVDNVERNVTIGIIVDNDRKLPVWNTSYLCIHDSKAIGSLLMI